MTNNTTDTEYHITSVRNGAVYGHPTTCCDAGGCAAREDRICDAADGPEIEAGDVLDLDTWTLASDDGQESVAAASAADACRRLLRSAGQHSTANSSTDPSEALRAWIARAGGYGSLLDSDGAPVWRVTP